MPEEQPVIRTALETFNSLPFYHRQRDPARSPASWKMVWWATSVREESNVLAPVLRLRSQRGWELDVISTRILCPGRKMIPVAHRSMMYSYTRPGSMDEGATGLTTP